MENKKSNHISAVITGDIVNSTQLQGPVLKKLLAKLKKIFEPNKYEFYRGDSFQVVMSDAKDSLKIALLCRASAISITESEISDVKLSVGLGYVDEKIKAPSMAKGEAFVISGRGLEELGSTDERLAIKSPDNYSNIAFEIVADYINSIFSAMTSRQAKVIFELLQGSQQQDVVKTLKRSKSTISQHASSGRWNEIEKLLEQYAELVKYLIEKNGDNLAN